jgi:alpha-methylacyl-CoA racemase
MASEFEHFWRSGRSRGPGDTHLTGRYPWYAVHETKDGGAMAVGAVEPAFHAALCRQLGHSELAAAQFPEGAELERTREAFAAAFSSQTRREAEASFEGEDTCVSPVLSTAEVAASPLMQRALRGASEAGEKLVRSPVRLTPAKLADERSGGALLARFGFSSEEIEALGQSGAMGAEG